MMPSQSSSMPLQISGEPPCAPVQAPHCVPGLGLGHGLFGGHEIGPGHMPPAPELATTGCTHCCVPKWQPHCAGGTMLLHVGEPVSGPPPGVVKHCCGGVSL